MASQFLTVEEVAARLRISRTKVYTSLIYQGKIGFLKCEGSYRISEDDLKKYIERNSFKAKRERPF